MPTYEYQCDACGHRFEAFQSIKADPIRRCPECKKLKVKRLISSGGGLIFKGSGFYITDYRDKGYSDKAKADAAPSSDGKSEPKSEGKPESKPETKAETKSEAKPEAKSESKPAAPSPSESKGGKSGSDKPKKA